MRKLFAKIHLWLSVPFGIIIAIVCLTGVVLVFETELLELCYPSRYFVREVQGKVLPPATLINSACQQLPDSAKINGIRISSDPQRTYQLILPGKKAVCFIDPYSGKITGIDDGQGFFIKVMKLHRWLLDEYKQGGTPSLGKTVVGISVMILVIIVVSGVVIWFPRSKKALKNRLTIKTGLGGKRFFYDLHVTGGFYVSLLLLTLALTGLTWSFDWYRDAFYSLLGVSKEQTEVQAQVYPVQKTHSGEKESMKEEGRKSEELLSDTSGNSRSEEHSGTLSKKDKQDKTIDYAQWNTVLSTLQHVYPKYNSITIQGGSATVSTACYGNTRGSDRYSFDSMNGKITKVQLYDSLSKTDKVRGWIYSVHVGSWGGIVTRVLYALGAFLGAVLAVTGYYFWIKKKFKKNIKVKAKVD